MCSIFSPLCLRTRPTGGGPEEEELQVHLLGCLWPWPFAAYFLLFCCRAGHIPRGVVWRTESSYLPSTFPRFSEVSLHQAEQSFQPLMPLNKSTPIYTLYITWVSIEYIPLLKGSNRAVKQLQLKGFPTIFPTIPSHVFSWALVAGGIGMVLASNLIQRIFKKTSNAKFAQRKHQWKK